MLLAFHAWDTSGGHTREDARSGPTPSARSIHARQINVRQAGLLRLAPPEGLSGVGLISPLGPAARCATGVRARFSGQSKGQAKPATRKPCSRQGRQTLAAAIVTGEPGISGADNEGVARAPCHSATHLHALPACSQDLLSNFSGIDQDFVFPDAQHGPPEGACCLSGLLVAFRVPPHLQLLQRRVRARPVRVAMFRQPCQKHPSTKTASRRPGSTMSGLQPAASRRPSLKRAPAACRALRRRISGVVLLLVRPARWPLLAVGTQC